MQGAHSGSLPGTTHFALPDAAREHSLLMSADEHPSTIHAPPRCVVSMHRERARLSTWALREDKDGENGAIPAGYIDNITADRGEGN